MRRVSVYGQDKVSFIEEKGVAGRVARYERQLIGEALFHQFVKFKSGVMAVIEQSDGCISVVPVSKIQFKHPLDENR